ncbi:MAG: hypothetical protein COB67_10235 [SAR324 cluster bacterium]|uniref:DUF86 domain-containing protein n=1 Tax=SAR324 cluster bacterium TaxID=2024889 RepID=A0A2A4SYX4_9DELT|nr:MAG: hypothetical protein COB67_10235 [SAR324 cluster bacterium]
MDNILINKAATIERCLLRIAEEYEGFEEELERDYTKQDSIILNLQRACEACLGIGNRMIRLKKLGIPQSSRSVFELLEKSRIIEPKLSKNLQAMVGFKNIAVHDYQSLNLEILYSILKKRLGDFRDFAQIAIQFL